MTLIANGVERFKNLVTVRSDHPGLLDEGVRSALCMRRAQTIHTAVEYRVCEMMPSYKISDSVVTPIRATLWPLYRNVDSDTERGLNELNEVGPNTTKYFAVLTNLIKCEIALQLVDTCP